MPFSLSKLLKKLPRRSQPVKRASVRPLICRTVFISSVVQFESDAEVSFVSGFNAE